MPSIIPSIGQTAIPTTICAATGIGFNAEGSRCILAIADLQ
jgi:hypothetical protein